MTVTKAIARCWTDADYKAKLLSDPHAALAEVGVEVPAGNTVKVMENTADTHHLVLPVSPPAAGELSSEELEKIAGGIKFADFLRYDLAARNQPVTRLDEHLGDRGKI